MTRNPPNPKRRPSSPHGGVTISEVLISMVIMAIGVVSLATLFPASVLRSIQASQLTNSALLSKNAMARLRFDTSLLSNNTVKAEKTLMLKLIDPFGMVIDPITNQRKYLLESSIGGQLGGIERISGVRGGGPSTQTFAESLAMLPDSWSLIRQDSIIGGYTPGTFQLTIASSADNFSNIIPRTPSSQGNPLYRMTIMDATGRYAATRLISEVNANQLSWASPNGLPDGFPFIPARCRVEVRDNRYTWMLTVRKNFQPPLPNDPTGPHQWRAEADLVVFFNRSFKAADEFLITAIQPTSSGFGGFDRQPGVAGVDDNLDGTVDNFTTNTMSGEENWPGSDDLRTLSYTGSLPPHLKKGSYLLETSQARWYRVVNINTNNNLILLDHDLIDLPLNGPFNFVAMKGITQVFELGPFLGSQ